MAKRKTVDVEYMKIIANNYLANSLDKDVEFRNIFNPFSKGQNDLPKEKPDNKQTYIMNCISHVNLPAQFHWAAMETFLESDHNLNNI